MLKGIGKFFAATFGKAADEKHVFHPSEKCRECGTPLMRVEESWRCGNPDCPAQIRAQIQHWCSPDAMDIPGGDAALVATLVSRGLVHDVAGLYQLKVRELAALPNLDQVAAQKIFDGISASRKRDAWQVLFGLSIPQVSAAAAQSLGRHFPSLDHVFDASAAQLKAAENIDEAVAETIRHWHGDPVNRRLLTRLHKFGVNFKSELYRRVTPGG